MQRMGLLCKLVRPESECVVAHLSAHGGEVPHAAYNGPAAHHVEEVIHHAELAAVPEGVPEARVILHKAISDNNLESIIVIDV